MAPASTYVLPAVAIARLGARINLKEPNMTTLSATTFIVDDDVAMLTDWPAAVAAIRRAYSHEGEADSVPPRTIATTNTGWLRTMTAAPGSTRLIGTKIISASTAVGAASYLIALFDRETSGLVALVDGNRITGIRTAATSAVAVDALAPSRPLRVAFIGSGFEARSHFAALASVRDIEFATVFSPTQANRELFASELGEQHGVPIEPAESARAAIIGADVIVCAARSRDESPTLLGEWLESGTTVVSVGSTVPSQREVDSEVIRRASVIVADEPDEVARDTGDMIAAADAGADFGDKLISLRQCLRLGMPGREGINLYKSTGSALQDIVMAEMLYERATSTGRGTVLPVGVSINKK
jgi:alanine dehydrogenase